MLSNSLQTTRQDSAVRGGGKESGNAQDSATWIAGRSQAENNYLVHQVTFFSISSGDPKGRTSHVLDVCESVCREAARVKYN